MPAGRCESLRAAPIPWLLEPENPITRFSTLQDMLDHPVYDPDVLQTQAAISTYPPLAELLAHQKPGGYWVKRDYYLPKQYGTFLGLCILCDAGLAAEHPQISKSCEFIFSFQRAHGPFCRRRRVSRQGTVWDTEPGPCTHARIVRFLIQFGYGADPRVRRAIGWLIEAQRSGACGIADDPPGPAACRLPTTCCALPPSIPRQPPTLRSRSSRRAQQVGDA